MKGWMVRAYRRPPSRKHFDYYLAEYAFRFNHRTARQRGLLFYRLIEATVAYGEVTQRAIVAGRSGRMFPDGRRSPVGPLVGPDASCLARTIADGYQPACGPERQLTLRSRLSVCGLGSSHGCAHRQSPAFL